MRVVFMGKEKNSVIDALKCLIKLGVEVTTIIAPFNKKPDNSELCNVAQSFHIPVCSDTDLYEHLVGKKAIGLNLENIDMVISFLFPKRIKKPLIDLSRLGCINFHSAPLPEYRGWGVYNAAILNNEQHWGVSAHFVDENFDTGDIIKVNCFNIDPKKETAFSLENRSQKELLNLFIEVMNIAILDKPLPRSRQKQEAGITYTKQDTLNHETVYITDSEYIIDKKIRAFWYPPFTAKIILNGRKYCLSTPEIMSSIDIKTWKNHNECFSSKI